MMSDSQRTALPLLECTGVIRRYERPATDAKPGDAEAPFQLLQGCRRTLLARNAEYNRIDPKFACETQ